MLDCHFCDLASEGPDIIMHQLKSIYNIPLKDSHSHPIRIYFPMIASNVFDLKYTPYLHKFIHEKYIFMTLMNMSWTTVTLVM